MISKVEILLEKYRFVIGRIEEDINSTDDQKEIAFLNEEYEEAIVRYNQLVDEYNSKKVA